MKQDALNAICPYFTMFPLSFPLKVLDKVGKPDTSTFDPFCGRGTTNFASRLFGFKTIGIDSNPVASAITSAKLVDVFPQEVYDLSKRILSSISSKEIDVPLGEFWELAYDKEVLIDICKYRKYLLECDNSNIDRALRGIILGALHGPTPKYKNSYFSNQCQRTYSPKPGYAVNYWKKNLLIPRKLDTCKVIHERAIRYYDPNIPNVDSNIINGDSRDTRLFLKFRESVDLIITSPPYYGMNTYYQDQWLRNWFVGGENTPNYSKKTQVEHSSPDVFAGELNKVWNNCEIISKVGAKAVIRYGGINDRKADSLSIIKKSLEKTNWKILTIKKAGHSENGRRQYIHFSKEIQKKSQMEYDVWLRLDKSH